MQGVRFEPIDEGSGLQGIAHWYRSLKAARDWALDNMRCRCNCELGAGSEKLVLYVIDIMPVQGPGAPPHTHKRY